MVAESMFKALLERLQEPPARASHTSTQTDQIRPL
ncbi:hypothetical protein VTN00DRAFT_1891 [Thermoascus crustaceus]